VSTHGKTLGEVRPFQVGAPEVGPFQAGFHEERPLQVSTLEVYPLQVSVPEALSTCCPSTGSTSMRVHDGLGRQSDAAVERLVMSCQVWNLCPSS
jgi:hypothetical protein